MASQAGRGGEAPQGKDKSEVEKGQGGSASVSVTRYRFHKPCVFKSCSTDNEQGLIGVKPFDKKSIHHQQHHNLPARRSFIPAVNTSTQPATSSAFCRSHYSFDHQPAIESISSHPSYSPCVSYFFQSKASSSTSFLSFSSFFLFFNQPSIPQPRPFLSLFRPPASGKSIQITRQGKTTKYNSSNSVAANHPKGAI